MRRQFLIALGAGALAPPLISFAQQRPARLYRIGFLGPSSAAGVARRLEEFRAGLRDLGYVEGRNFVIEFRWAEGKYDRLPELAAELVRLKVDLIVTYSAPGTLSAMRATTSIPIVMMAVGDAIASGIVASLARPGGNVTGLSFFTPELNVKRLELLKDVFPRIRRVAVLFNSDNAAAPLPAMEAAAAGMKVELRRFGVSSQREFESAFAEMSKRRIEAVAIHDDPMLIANVGAAVSLASRHRIPSIGFSELADAGGLISYGVDLAPMARRSAVFVDKILKGANPGELPIERATSFDLIINRKTEKALGITIPQPVLMRAVRVIE